MDLSGETVYWNYAGDTFKTGDYTATLLLATGSDYLYDIAWEADLAAISNEKITLTKGFSHKLKITNAGDNKITWKSSDKKIATVDKNGKVTAKAAGSCKITATVGDQKLVCKVTVKKNEYSRSKVVPSDFSYGRAGLEAYHAAYDSKGNLVVNSVLQTIPTLPASISSH